MTGEVKTDVQYDTVVYRGLLTQLCLPIFDSFALYEHLHHDTVIMPAFPWLTLVTEPTLARYRM